MEKTINIQYDGIDFEIRGSYERGYRETREDPGQPDILEDVYVFIGDYNVTEVLRDSIIVKLAELAVEAIGER